MKGEVIHCADGRIVRDHGDTISIFIPMEIRRRSGRKEIVLPDTPAHASPGECTRFQIALARAFLWQSWLDEGRFEDNQALAAHLGLDVSFVRRVLNVGQLSPRIVEAILAGREPGMTLREAMDAQWPALWSAQEAMVWGSQAC